MNNTLCGHSPLLFCDHCLFDRAKAKAQSEGHELTYDELNCVFTAAIARSSHAEAESVLNVFKREFTPAEHEEMIANAINRGWYDLARGAAEKAGRSLTQKEKDQSVIIGLQENDDNTQLVNLVSQGVVSKDGMNTLIKVCITKALPQTAQFLAEKVGRSLTTSEVEFLISICKETGYEDRISDARALMAA